MDAWWFAFKEFRGWRRLTRQKRRRELNFEVLEDRRVLTTMHPTYMIARSPGDLAPQWSTGPNGFNPSALRHAYGLDLVQFQSIVGDGTGQTIAIVDAYDHPYIASDLAVFDAQFGLPAPPSFTKVDQNGGTIYPAAGNGWPLEISLDVEWAHVMAPKASILLVEAASALDTDLWKAVDTARSWPGVTAVSMSFGGDEGPNDSSNDFHFTTPAGHAGVTFFAATGDNGSYSANTSTQIIGYPAASVNVVAVGGTTLSASTNGDYTSESGWGYGTSSGTSGGSGGGFSQYISKPSYQNGITTPFPNSRTIPDVSIDADPNTGVPVYDSYTGAGQIGNWIQVGGTSLSTPLFAGIMAVANQGRALYGLGSLDGSTGTLPKLYSLPASDFHDITSGNNGYAAGPGYDLVTGIGTPIANLAVADIVGPVPTISGFSATLSSVSLGGYSTLSAAGVTESGGTVTGVNFYRETNGIAGLQIGADTLVAAGSQVGSTWRSLVSTAGLPNGNYTYYAVAADGAGARSLPSSTSIAVTSSNGFANWNAVSSAIANVPLGIGPLANVSVVNSGNTVYTGSLDVTNTLNRIRGNVGSLGAPDGGLFDNSGNVLPPAAAWYQFVVDPVSGSDQNLGDSFSFPGPMRILIDNNGNAYFSGDNNATFVSLFAAGPAPTFGSFALNASTINVNGSSVLTANNVASSSGSITSVAFYRESNGIPGLQIGLDTFVGFGFQNGSNWTQSAGAATLAPGAYTYYAVATDNANNVATASAGLTINSVVVSGALLAWDTANQTNYGSPAFNATFVSPGVTNSLVLSRGYGVNTVNTASIGGWGGNGWAPSAATAYSQNKYVTFGFTVSAGEVVSLSSVAMNYRRNSSSGPPNGSWQFKVGAGAWTALGDFTNQFPTTNGAATTPVSLSGVAALQNLPAGTDVSFRIAPFGGSSSTANWYVYNLSGNDLIVNGTIKPATTTTIGAALNPAVFGQANTVTVSVAGGSGTPTGNVQLFDNGSQIGTVALIGGTAVFDVSSLGAGTHPLTATYAGDSSHAVSATAAPLSYIVNKAATTTSLSGAPNPSAGGAAVTLTATISIVSPGGGTPAGSVDFWDGAVGTGTLLGSNTVSTSAQGTTASLSIGSFAPGSHVVYAVYNGSANFSASTGQSSQSVTPYFTATALTANGPNPSTVGVGASFTITVAGGPAISGETVDLKDASNGNAVVASVLLASSSVTFSVSNLQAGTHQLFADYSGDGSHLASQSSQVLQVVNPLPAPPSLISTVVNGADAVLLNLPSPYTEQRSMVRSIQLTFDSPVTLTPTAVSIAVHDATGVVPEVITVLNSIGGTGLDTIWNVTFGGRSVQGGSIADGEYDLTVNPSGVADASNQNPVSAPPVFTFYRLLGDVDGDRSVTTPEIIYIRRLANTTSSAPDFQWLFDTDWNGTINTSDIVNFRRNANKTI